MARIRSIHPGLLTDEAFMALGHSAFRLYMGLLMEADDQGVFEWKPITLKARILPAHNEDVIALLAELTVATCVVQFTANGKVYGAIRNFMKWQRPRRPTISHPLPSDMAAFVGRPSEQTANTPADVGNGDPPADDPPDNVGKGPADGGGRREEGGGKRKSNNYAFAGLVIRLKAEQLAKWQKAYPNIPNLTALLQSRDDWLATQPAAVQERWFVSTSNWLSNKDGEAVLTARAPPKPAITPLGVGG
jgi:hypothetical protein